MDHDLQHDGAVLGQTVVAVFGSDGMRPKTIEKPFRELLEF
jgi:hypothetical protein